MTDPAATPVTVPPELTTATDELLVLHVPPDVASVSTIVAPAHTVDAPDIAVTVGVLYGFTEIALVA